MSTAISFYGWKQSTVWMDHIFLMYSLVDKHVACLHFLAIMNNDAMNIHVCDILNIIFNYPGRPP